MTICAEFIHCTLAEFRALSNEERTLWRMYVQEKWRRDKVMADKQREELEAQRKAAAASKGG